MYPLFAPATVQMGSAGPNFLPVFQPPVYPVGQPWQRPGIGICYARRENY
jgi:hypothetical protein